MGLSESAQLLPWLHGAVLRSATEGVSGAVSGSLPFKDTATVKSFSFD